MSRTLAAGVEAILAAFGIEGVIVAASFATSGINVTNAPRDVTVGTTTYTGVGSRGLAAAGIGESLLAEVPQGDLTISSIAFGYHANVFADLLRGDKVTIKLLYSAGGAWAVTGWSSTYTVDTDGASPDAVQVRLVSADAAIGTALPRRTTHEYGCQHNYKRGGCPYRGALPTCDKGYDTPNGCAVHFPVLTTSFSQTVPQSKPYGALIGHMDRTLVQR